MRQKVHEPKMPKAELDLYLATLPQAIDDILALHDGRIRFSGLPIEEWAGPGYAIAALFDPYVLGLPSASCRMILDGPSADQDCPGLQLLETRATQKEMIAFRLNPGRTARYYLPAKWGGMNYHRLQASSPWRSIASLGELPAVLVREGTAVFAFNPLRVMHRYLNMADPSITRDFTDLLVKAILAASGSDQDIDDHDLRRDFHALGVNAMLICQMYRAIGQTWSILELRPALGQAAQRYLAGDHDAARRLISEMFAVLEQKRKQIVGTPIYIMVMPHGGILFEREGYAEYDWPEAAARGLNLLLDWAERSGFHFAPDIGASTLEQFATIYPATIARFKAAWNKGIIEFVNGTHTQPYFHVLPTWDQDKQFEVGLETFQKLFGKRPTVFASQVQVLHSALPPLLKKHGYRHAIHRAQNLGNTPLDSNALIEWHSPGDPEATIRTLPAHPLRSEKRGGEIWRQFPVLLTRECHRDLPFIALTNLMDQTYFDIYNEEIVRANHYAPVWGEFLTPTAFFERTQAQAAPPKSYRHDDYDYGLDLTANKRHMRYSGGYSSEQAFLRRESLRLRELEAAGRSDPLALRLFLEQEAHDCYLIPDFPQGQYMHNQLSDYYGPRMIGPDGANRVIRQTVLYPLTFQDDPGATPQPCEIRQTTLKSSMGSAVIDAKTGAVARLNDQAVSLGLPRYNGSSMTVSDVDAVSDRLRVRGVLSGFGPLAIEYFLNDGRLYGVLDAFRPLTAWESSRTSWDDCVYLEHARRPETQVVRVVGDLAEATELVLFHSLETLTLRSDDLRIVLRHGGNIFFRQDQNTVHNRLWCHDEFCTRFWWSVELETRA